MLEITYIEWIIYLIGYLFFLITSIIMMNKYFKYKTKYELLKMDLMFYAWMKEILDWLKKK